MLAVTSLPPSPPLSWVIRGLDTRTSNARKHSKTLTNLCVPRLLVLVEWHLVWGWGWNRRADLKDKIDELEHELQDTHLQAEQERLKHLLHLLAPQEEDIRHETESIMNDGNRAARDHQHLYAQRLRENNNLRQELLGAKKDAQSWHDQVRWHQHEQNALKSSVSSLDEAAHALATAAKPHEARRRELLGLLHRISSEPWAQEALVLSQKLVDR